MLRREESWINTYDVVSIPRPVRGVAPVTLKAVLAAIEAKSALMVIYQSMASPDPTERWIEPHALGFDGFRWHARAFCLKDNVFKDFLLSRIVAVKGQGPATSTADQDSDWHTEVTLQIGPHPELSKAQRQAIELDYDMQQGRGAIVVRQALIFYTLNRLGLSRDPAALRPQDQQIVLLNPEVVNLPARAATV